MTCGCNNNSNNPSSNAIEIGGCGTAVPATPCGSSDCSSSCVEDHCQKIYVTQFYTTIRPDSSWNVPACGQTAEFYVTNLKSLAVGSFIWNATFGYFEVTAFDVSRGKVTVKNPCYTGTFANAAVGTLVPGCSEFLVTPQPCCGDTGLEQTNLYPYVAVSFTAPPVCPNVGCCLVITVTTAIGLSVGGNIQIGTGVYRIDSIIDLYHITICNDGTGIVPGTSVVAQDGAGNYSYPIVSLDASPCNKASPETGAMVVCSNGAMTTLNATVDGMVPVVVDHVTNEVQYQSLAIEAIPCEMLIAPLTITNGQATYTLTLTGVAQFQATDVVRLLIGVNYYEMTIANVAPGPLQITGTILPVPTISEDGDVAPIDTLVCMISCCERMGIISDDLQDQIDVIDTNLATVTCAPICRYAVIPEVYLQPIVSLTQTRLWYVTLSFDAAVVTSPDECDDATYLVEAFLEVDNFIGIDPQMQDVDLPDIYSELTAGFNVGSQSPQPKHRPGRDSHSYSNNPPYSVQAGANPVAAGSAWDDLYNGDVPGLPMRYWRAHLIATAVIPKNTTTSMWINALISQDDTFGPLPITRYRLKWGGYTKCTRIT